MTIVTLDDVQAWWTKFEDYEATYVKAETAAWRFRVKHKEGTRSTDVLIPFNASEKVLRETIGRVVKFFQVFK